MNITNSKGFLRGFLLMMSRQLDSRVRHSLCLALSLMDFK